MDWPKKILIKTEQASRYSDYARGWKAESLWFDFRLGQDIFSSPIHPDRVLDPLSLLFKGTAGAFPGG